MSFQLSDVESNVWPKRLLRISDMTSYECVLDGKDAYYRKKKDKNPAYAIMSYTWGRFRADGKSGLPYNPKGEAISVKGITWDIPTMDPVTGFSKDKFKNILKTVAGKYDYVWVDVACINQDKDEEDEIGHQAAIFNRASASYIWLHQQMKKGDDVKLGDRVSGLVEYVNRVQNGESAGQPQDKSQLLAARHQHEQLVLGLLHDPWFSSLWTLQEAFLQKNAVILPRTGDATTVVWNGRQTQLTLAVLINICEAYLNLPYGPNRGEYEVNEAIKAAGLNSLSASNPLVLLRDARHRYAKDKDRVFGIQQIFGVALSSAGLSSQTQLERSLWISVIQRCPALAQLFFGAYIKQDIPSWQLYFGTYTTGKIFSTDPPPTDPAARVPRRRGQINGRTAGIEDTLYVPTDFFNAQVVPNSEGEYPRVSGDPASGYLRLQGLSFDLEALWQMWRVTERARIPPGLEQGHADGPNSNPSPQELPYQNSFTCSIYDDGGKLSGIDPSVQQYLRPLREVYKWCGKFPGQIKVLILGRIQQGQGSSAAQAWVGLLVWRGRPDRRVGFCTWKDPVNRSQLVNDDCQLG